MKASSKIVATILLILGTAITTYGVTRWMVTSSMVAKGENLFVGYVDNLGQSELKPLAKNKDTTMYGMEVSKLGGEHNFMDGMFYCIAASVLLFIVAGYLFQLKVTEAPEVEEAQAQPLEDTELIKSEDEEVPQANRMPQQQDDGQSFAGPVRNNSLLK